MDCSIGIDIGGTNLRFALVTRSGEIMHRSRTTSSIAEGREAFCDKMLAGVTDMLDVAARQKGRVAGIGIGVPGLVSRDGLITASVNMRPLDGFNLAQFVQESTHIPCRCANDANLIALGEYMFGAGQGMNSLIVITIGTGLGSGLILDGRLWSGVDGLAAEFGHVTVEPDGIPCPCGNRGCLEQYVSAGAIVRAAHQHSEQGREPLEGGPADASAVAAQARKGDVAASSAFEQAGRYLGIALGSLANTLNLEAAIIGGGVSASFDLLQPSLFRELSGRAFPQIASRMKIIPCRLGDDAGLLGGAALVPIHASMDMSPPLDFQ